MGKKKPSLISLLLSDNIIIDRDTKKHSAIGIFNKFQFKEFPTSFSHWRIYASVADIPEGKHEFGFVFKHQADGHSILSIKGYMNIEQENGYLEIAPPIPNILEFVKPGMHILIFLIDDEEIGSRTIDVTKIEG